MLDNLMLVEMDPRNIKIIYYPINHIDFFVNKIEVQLYFKF